MRRCNKCGFDMTAKVIDAGVTIFTCPLGHRFTQVTARPSAYKAPRQRIAESTYPENLETK